MKQTHLNFKPLSQTRLLVPPISQQSESSSKSIASFSSITITNDLSSLETTSSLVQALNQNSSSIYSENNQNDPSPIPIVIEKMVPDQPTDFKPVKDKYNTYFKIKWYDNFTWLEYDIVQDRAFCFICRKFNRKETKSDSFVSNGFKTWKNAYDRFGEHEKSSAHQTAKIKWHHAIKKGPSCASLVTKQHEDEIFLNRQCLGQIIKVIMLLGKQGLAFRGHRESSLSENRGNFLEFINHLANDYSQNLKKFITQYSNAKYLSPDIQIELKAIISNEILNGLIDKIKKNKYFSIIVDGTTDINHEEQISFCIRTVSKDLSIH